MLFKLFTLILVFPFIICCPPQEQLSPCMCQNVRSAYHIKCSNVDELDLMNAADGMKSMDRINSLTIRNTALRFIPFDLFEGIKISRILFDHSSVRTLSERDIAFKGLENYLDRLSFHDCSQLNSLDWSQLKNMNELTELDVLRGDMETIRENIRELNHQKLRQIVFYSNKISHISDNAFSSFTELSFFSLNKNLIKEFKRSMLPNPAPKLKHINLGDNEIKQLPEDIFENMPILESISLPMNKFLTLKEETFAPVWTQLKAFDLLDNNIQCDCSISWILEKRKPRKFRGICDKPAHLKGRKLADLNSKDLSC